MKYIFISCFIVFLASCTSNQAKLENINKKKLRATVELTEISGKQFLLDSNTAPIPYYIQIITDSLGIPNFTFLNKYNNSIYFYNYKTEQFLKKITFDDKGPNAIPKPMGYYIKNMDSIYIFSSLQQNVFLTNNKKEILHKISLVGEIDIQKSGVQSWSYTYPEFYIETVKPFIKSNNELLLSGYFGGNMPDSLIDKFKFTAHINFKTNKVKYTHSYPKPLYGDNYNWGGGLNTEVFTEMHPNGKKLIYSFPVSHDLFITDLDETSYERIYAGSNFAGVSSSIDKKQKQTTSEMIISRFVKQDVYAAILYDKYRNVYYRFLRKAMPNASVETSWKDKEIAVIIMDENFNYLGENVVGTERICHWQNSFVTEEGLNIEFIEENNVDELYLNLKLFVPQKK